MSDTRVQVAVAAVVVLAAVAGVVAAVDVTNEDVPEGGEIGTPTEVSVTVTNVYEGPSRWTLVGSTQLQDAEWEITYYNQTGAEVDTVEAEGPTVEGVGITPEMSIANVTITVSGDVPPVQGNYTYPDQNTFEALSLSQNPEDGTPETFKTYRINQFTPQSQQARQALDEARAAIDEAEAAGVDVSQARSTFENARAAYRKGNFGLAQDLANEARTQAENARNQSEQQGQTLQLILIGVGVLVLLAIAAGGFYVYRQRQQQDTRLR